MAHPTRKRSAIEAFRRDDERFGIFLVLLSIPMSASLPVLGALGSRMVAPVIFGALVSLFGALFLGSITWREILTGWNRGISSHMVHLFVVGLFGTALVNLFLFWGLTLTTGANAAILLQVEPVYALLLTFLLRGERPTRTQLFAMALIMTGAITVLCPGTFSICRGDLLVLTVPLFLVIANLMAQSCMRDGIPARVVVTFRLLWGSIILALVGLATDSWHGIPWTSRIFMISMLSMAIFGMSMNNLFWYMAIARLPLSRCTTIISAYPVLAVVCSWIFLGESPQWTQVVGLALVLTGICQICRRTSAAVPVPEATTD